MKQNTVNIAEILSYLHRKKGYFENILKLTLIQEKAVKSANLTDLNRTITEKENLIKDISHIDKLNINIQGEISLHREGLMSDHRFASLLKQLQSLITAINNHDQKCCLLLHSLIDDTKTRINNLNKKRRAQHSTRKHQIQQPSFIDIFQ